MLWLLPTILLSVSCHIPSEAVLPPRVVSVSAQIQEEGRVCLVVHNGTQTPVFYDQKDNREGRPLLERRVLWQLWVGVRYATLGEWWRDLVQMRTLQIVTPSPISPQTTRSHLLRYPLRTFPAGQYRVCFRYRLGGEEDGRETCSAPFAHSMQFFGDKEGEGWEIICDGDDLLNPCPPTDTAILFRMPPLAPTMQKSPSATETSLRETANVVSQRCDIVVFHPLLPVLETGPLGNYGI